MTKEELDQITEFIADFLYDHAFDNLDEVVIKRYGKSYGMWDILSSLHNVLYKVVNGEGYHYMFHWANKAGFWVEDDLFMDDGGKIRGDMNDR